MNDLLIAALTWVIQGFAVLPIAWRNKTPDARLLPSGSWEYLKDTLPTEQQLEVWFAGRLHNIGLVMGWNNLVVLDFDNMAAYDAWRQVNQVETYEVKTNRGMHVYTQIAEPVSNSHSELIDIKAHGYVLIPPSIHPSGHIYSIKSAAPIIKVEQLTDILPAALIPQPPAPTEFIPKPVKNSVATGDIWDALDNPLNPDEDMIKQIRARVSLLDLVPGASRTSQDGRWYTALCPFHDDHHPSFWVDLSRQICGCRSCGMQPMDVVNFYSRLHGLNNRDAILQLAKGI